MLRIIISDRVPGRLGDRLAQIKTAAGVSDSAPGREREPDMILGPTATVTESEAESLQVALGADLSSWPVPGWPSLASALPGIESQVPVRQAHRRAACPDCLSS